MVRFLVILSVFAMLACGGSDTGEKGAAGGAAPGGESASAPATPERSAAAQPAAELEPMDPAVRNCLDLVRRKKFEPALGVCRAALERNPGNQQIQDALEKAKLAAPAEAAEAGGQAAAEKAASGLQEATGGVPDKPGQ